MSFREQLDAVAMEPIVGASLLTASDSLGNPIEASSYKMLKSRMHLKLLEKFDLAALETLPPEELRQEISAMVGRLLLEEQTAVNDIEKRTLIRDIQHEMLGFGPSSC